MNKQTVKEIAMKHNLVHETQNDRYSDDVYNFADELLRHMRMGQYYHNDLLVRDLKRVSSMIKSLELPSHTTVQKGIIIDVLNELVKGLTEHNL